MKNLALIIIALMFCSLCYGQESYFAYKTYGVQPNIYRRDYYEGKAFTSNLGKPETNDFTFPIFSNSSKKYVEAISKIVS